MSINETNLILQLIEECYSKDVMEIVKYMLSNPNSSIVDINNNTIKQMNSVKDYMIILVQNNLVSIKSSNNNENFLDVNAEIKYSVIKENCINILRQPKILHYIKSNFGELSMYIVEVFMLNGILSLNQAIECLDNYKNISKNQSDIRKDLLSLISHHIIHQTISHKDKANIKLSNSDNHETNKKSLKKKKKEISLEEDKDNTNLNLKENDLDDFYFSKNDESDIKVEIFYTLNYSRINSILKTEFILESISKTISLQAAQLSQMFINCSGFMNDKFTTSLSFSLKELINLNKTQNNIPQFNINQLEEIIKKTKNETSIFKAVGINDSGKEIYCLDLDPLYSNIKKRLKEKIIEQLFSNLHSRVYRLLNKCGPLDIKNIMDVCMIPNKDCSKILNQLFKSNFIEIQELHIKGSPQFFFKVTSDFKSSSLLNIIYKIIFNLKTLINKKINLGNEMKSKDTQIQLQVSKILTVVSELDKYVLLLN